MVAVITLSGNDVGMVSDKDMALAIEAAKAVFASHDVDPLACELANQKQYTDVEISRDEALLCIYWEEANYAACHIATLGWMSRNVDLYLRIEERNVGDTIIHVG